MLMLLAVGQYYGHQTIQRPFPRDHLHFQWNQHELLIHSVQKILKQETPEIRIPLVKGFSEVLVQLPCTPESPCSGQGSSICQQTKQFISLKQSLREAGAGKGISAHLPQTQLSKIYVLIRLFIPAKANKQNAQSHVTSKPQCPS